MRTVFDSLRGVDVLIIWELGQVVDSELNIMLMKNTEMPPNIPKITNKVILKTLIGLLKGLLTSFREKKLNQNGRVHEKNWPKLAVLNRNSTTKLQSQWRIAPPEIFFNEPNLTNGHLSCQPNFLGSLALARLASPNFFYKYTTVRSSDRRQW